jgi:hypothetical protein
MKFQKNCALFDCLFTLTPTLGCMPNFGPQKPIFLPFIQNVWGIMTKFDDTKCFKKSPLIKVN